MDDLLADFVAETREMLEASGGEIVDADGGAEIRRRLGLLVLERDTGGVGDPVDGVEQTRHSRRIGQRQAAHGGGDFLARHRQFSVIANHDRGGKAQQQVAIGDATTLANSDAKSAAYSTLPGSPASIRWAS